MSALLLPGILIMCVLLIVLLQFGFIFLLLALLPALVACFIDREKGKPTFKIVLACNVASTLPSLAPMIQSSIHMKLYDVSTVMSNPNVWLFVYVGAAAGWALIYLCRFIARFIVTLTYEYTILSLETRQKALVDEWGTQIKQPLFEPGI